MWPRLEKFMFENEINHVKKNKSHELHIMLKWFYFSCVISHIYDFTLRCHRCEKSIMWEITCEK